MTLTINLDDATQTRLTDAAIRSGQSLEDYVAEVLRSSSQPWLAGSKPNLGFAANWGIKIADDFDEPLEEFKEYT